MPTPLLLKVTPIHTRETTALVCPVGDELRVVRIDVYPPQTVAAGEALRQARLAAGLSLRDAALRTGLRGRDVSNLEQGRVVFAHEHERAAYLAALVTDTLTGEADVR